MSEAAFLGLDVHKKTIQMCAMDAGGNELFNKTIHNTPGDIRYHLGGGGVPGEARLVTGS